jgi:hypothetical protein
MSEKLTVGKIEQLTNGGYRPPKGGSGVPAKDEIDRLRAELERGKELLELSLPYVTANWSARDDGEPSITLPIAIQNFIYGATR